MATIVTRAGKGTPLTNTELDSNFTNLNTDKVEVDGALGTPSSGTLTNATGLPIVAGTTGTLSVARGGTGTTTSTGTGSTVLSNSPALVTPALGTPASGVATNLTGLPLTTGVTGTLPIANGGTGITSFGTGVATWFGTPSSANLAAAVTDETGTGALVFANSPTLVTPALGTPASGVATNLTGTAAGLTAGNVTTNADLTGAITSTGNATVLGSFSSANLAGALTDETGTGAAVFAVSPALTGTPTINGIDVQSALAQGIIASFTWDSGTTSPAATVAKQVPQFVLDNLYNQIKGCVLNSSGVVVYYLKATDWSQKADGTASDLTGTDGNVMVEIPKFYYRTTFVGTVTTWEISPVQVSGFTLHPAFILDDVEVDKRYYSAYDACVYDDSAEEYISGTNLTNNSGNVNTAADKLSSVKGVYPMVGLTRNEFRLLAAVNGTGWRQLDFALWCAAAMLYVVEYQTFFSQDELGNGNTNNSFLGSSANQNDSPLTIAGLRDDVGNGSTTDANGEGAATKPGTVAMKYRGIENFFGNCWNWADGININVSGTGNVHLANNNDRANYADNTATGHTLVSSSLTTGSNNIQALLPLGPYFLASAVGGTSSQYVTDRHYGSSSSNRVALVSGGAADAADAGVFSFRATPASASRSRRLGGRLAK